MKKIILIFFTFIIGVVIVGLAYGWFASAGHTSNNSIKRVNDIRYLQGYLAEYKTKYGGYPETLSALVPEFTSRLETINQNYLTSLCKDYSEYKYEPLGKQTINEKTVVTDYRLTYCLDIATEQNGTSLAPGVHTVKP
jgi:type II secretory pathway pseudopilin PulG